MQLFIANKWMKPHGVVVFFNCLKRSRVEAAQFSLWCFGSIYSLHQEKREELTDGTEPSARICHQVREVMGCVAVRKSLACQFQKKQASSTIQICQSSGCLRSNVAFWINFTCTGLMSLPKIQVQPVTLHTHRNLEIQSMWEEKVRRMTLDGPQFVKLPKIRSQ